MTNQEIDHKLAEAMGYKELVENEGYLWEPSTDMSDAWEVAERFGKLALAIEKTVHSKLHPERERYTAYIGMSSAVAETAPMAICLAALRVIERDKNDKKANI